MPTRRLPLLATALLALHLGLARAGERPVIELPVGESRDLWAETLAIAGLVAEVHGDGPWVSVLVEGGTWRMVATDAGGTRREVVVPAPGSESAREDVAILAASLLRPVNMESAGLKPTAAQPVGMVAPPVSPALVAASVVPTRPPRMRPAADANSTSAAGPGLVGPPPAVTGVAPVLPLVPSPNVLPLDTPITAVVPPTAGSGRSAAPSTTPARAPFETRPATRTAVDAGVPIIPPGPGTDVVTGNDEAPLPGAPVVERASSAVPPQTPGEVAPRPVGTGGVRQTVPPPLVTLDVGGAVSVRGDAAASGVVLLAVGTRWRQAGLRIRGSWTGPAALVSQGGAVAVGSTGGAILLDVRPVRNVAWEFTAQLGVASVAIGNVNGTAITDPIFAPTGGLGMALWIPLAGPVSFAPAIRVEYCGRTIILRRFGEADVALAPVYVAVGATFRAEIGKNTTSPAIRRGP